MHTICIILSFCIYVALNNVAVSFHSVYDRLFVLVYILFDIWVFQMDIWLAKTSISFTIIQKLFIMESALSELLLAEHAAEEMANLQFHHQGTVSYSVRSATPKDMKWIEERRYTRYSLSMYEYIVERLNEQFPRFWKRFRGLFVFMAFQSINQW